MAFSYNLSTDAGKVRAMIPDSKEATYLFEDDEINVFLLIEGHIKRATALALETIASDQALVLKVIKVLDITTDGAKVSDALLKRAKMLREQVDAEIVLSDQQPAIDIAEMVLDDFTWRERMVKQSLRGGL